jgi:hypothetical protein
VAVSYAVSLVALGELKAESLREADRDRTHKQLFGLCPLLQEIIISYEAMRLNIRKAALPGTSFKPLGIPACDS